MKHHHLALAAFALGVAALVSPTPSQATVIDLATAGVAGTGGFFCGAGNAQQVSIDVAGYTVVLSGGTPLGPNIAFLPATASVAYGTADFANNCPGQSGYTNPLTINFYAVGTTNALNVNNFFVDLYNGNTVAVDYTLADNLGNTATFNIGDNLSSGQQTFGFAAAGSSFTITGGPATNGCCAWDFFINNIGFNQALPIPEPGTLALLGLALPMATLYRRRRTAHQLHALS